jgi:hypothetical protein
MIESRMEMLDLHCLDHQKMFYLWTTGAFLGKLSLCVYAAPTGRFKHAQNVACGESKECDDRERLQRTRLL